MIISTAFVIQLFIAVAILIGARVASALVMYALRHSKMITKRTKTTLDDLLVERAARPIHIAFQLAALVGAFYYLFPSLEYGGYGYFDAVIILAAFWGGYMANRLVRGAIDWWETQGDGEEEHKGTFGFLYTLASIIIWGLSVTFVLNQLGVDVTALVAGLGIAGVALAFALQSTIAGLFAAVYLAIDRPLRPGDYIMLSDGTTGFVQDMTMRSTRILGKDNNLVIVPNHMLADMVVTNYFLPNKEVRVFVEVGVAYGSDLDKVETVLIEAANSLLEAKEAKGSAEPFVRFTMFSPSSVTVQVYVTISSFLDQAEIKHRLMKEVKDALVKEKIEIPFPQIQIHQKK
jgi:MscS family membrane protein